MGNISGLALKYMKVKDFIHDRYFKCKNIHFLDTFALLIKHPLKFLLLKFHAIPHLIAVFS